MKGKHFTEEQRKYISERTKEAMANLPEDKKIHVSYWKGKKQTEEMLRKRAETLKKVLATPEAKKKMHDSRVGRKLPPRSKEFRELMSKLKKGLPSPNKGKHWTEETKFKIADAIRGKKKWHNVETQTNMYAFECPGDGWLPGFLPKKKE